MAINITLPESYYKRLQQLAQKSGKDIEDVLSALSTLLQPSLDEFDELNNIEELPDEKITALAKSKMNWSLNQRFSALQYKQQAEKLTESEQSELELLLTIYHTGQLRKAQAMIEAQRRGLDEGLHFE